MFLGAEKASRNPDIAQFFATLGLARGSSKCFLRNNSPGFTNRLCQSSYYKTTLRQHVLAHRSAIYCLKYDRRSEYLISASDDYTIKIWALQSSDGNLCTPFLRHTLRGHLAEIIEVDVSIDNHLLVSVDADCALVIWCLRSGQPLVSFRGSRRNRVVSGLSFIPILSPPPPPSGSPAERSGWLLVSSYGCGLHFIRYTHTLVGEEERLRRGEDTFITTCCSLKLHPTITFPTNESDSGPRNNSFAVVLDVSPGGHYVALGCSDHVVRLFTFSEDGQPTSAGTLLAHEDSVNSVSFSNSGLQLATGSADAGSCWLWNLKAGSWVGTELKLRKRPKSRPCILRWSRNDTYLIVCLKSGSVHVFDGKTGEFVSVLTGHEGAVFAVATSPLSDEILATGGADGRFYIWRLEERSSSVVFFYRYPAPQVTTDLGITWLQSTSLEVPLPQATGAGPAVDDDDERRRLRSAFSVESGVQTQRITCCIASPGADGPGFFVATKAGVISLFAPNLDIDAKPRLVNDGPPPYEEQFLHWEMDNAAAREVRTPSSAAQSSAGSVALTLGSPAASQSFGLRPPTPPQPDQQQSSSSQVFFQPPEGVLFQLVHEPSGVPFSRLPPGYLTSLRSCAYPPGRQRAQVPGRHSNSLLDAQPTLTLDDNGEEVVVDDIQFCADVPPSYTYPLPVRTAKAPIPGKHYFWRCHWLSGEADLIRPLSSLDLECVSWRCFG
uniref:WD_REPEATS_REGION domain-containing protein n=1 Tax=Mesocestoides corti TaxID=53468 RepID=A0A5K3ESA4_MESCO